MIRRSAAEPHKKVPTPPDLARATPEQVARKALRGIKKNKPLVLVTPMAYALWYIKRLSPGLFDRINCLGRRKKRPALAEESLPAAAPVVVSWQDTAADREAADHGRPVTGKLEFERHYFQSHGARCESWLLRPAGSEPSPLVVAAYGFAAEKSFRLPAYAERFVAGRAVMLFDYRHFGGSGGMPRHLISHRLQRQDWQAALDFGRNLLGDRRSRASPSGHVAQRGPRLGSVRPTIRASRPSSRKLPCSNRCGCAADFRTTMFAAWQAMHYWISAEPPSDELRIMRRWSAKGRRLPP